LGSHFFSPALRVEPQTEERKPFTALEHSPRSVPL
jgi:hypothetical protein